MTTDPILALLNRYDAAWNAHDEEGVLSAYADRVTITVSPPPPPPLRATYQGIAEVRQWVQAMMPGFQIVTTGHQVNGSTASWQFTVRSDGLRRLGLDQASGTSVAVIENGRIVTFRPTFDVATVERMKAASTASLTVRSTLTHLTVARSTPNDG